MSDNPNPELSHDKKPPLAPSQEFVKEMERQKTAEKSQQPAAQPTTSGPPKSGQTASEEPSPNQPAQEFHKEYQTLYPDLAQKPQPPVQPLGPDPYDKVGWFDSVPKGVLVIVILTLIGAISNFAFNSSKYTDISTSFIVFIAAVTFGLSIGLLFGSNICRIVIMIISTLAAFSAFVGFFQLIDAQQSYQAAREILSTKISEIEGKRNPTSEEKKQLTAYKTKLTDYQQIRGSTFIPYYLTYLANFLYSGFVVIYLLRPKIKEYFEP
jgi:hypothetical protein